MVLSTVVKKNSAIFCSLQRSCFLIDVFIVAFSVSQMANWKANMKISKSSSSSSQTVQQRVEETRTMITQSSQKSYHIE